MKTLKLILAGSFFLSTVAFTFSLPTDASAHENKLDGLGCHYARAHRNYHCHEGVMKGKTFKSKGDAMRNWNRLKREAAKDQEDDDGLF